MASSIDSSVGIPPASSTNSLVSLVQTSTAADVSGVNEEETGAGVVGGSGGGVWVVGGSGGGVWVSGSA